MQLEGRTILVLGGAGLVGLAVCRELLAQRPGRLLICSLRREEVDEALAVLRRQFPDSPAQLLGVHGNVFVRTELKDTPREGLLADRRCRRMILEDTLLPLTEEVLQRSFLYRLLVEHRPHAVVDCVNTATALAYQDLYRSAQEVLEHLDAGHGIETFRHVIEKHLCTLYTPQLVRHIQILYEGLRRAGSEVYIKIGTSGTGGMGLNIPYTHSEERPSRMLLSKSAMAGAHTLLLFLMARTPDAPIVKEIKPAAAVAWKRIGFGPILRGGRPIPLYDCPPQAAVDLEEEPDLGASREFAPLGEGEPHVLRSVFIDTGENGMFSRAEFEVVTTLGQMEFVTPEEIARHVRFELQGIASGHEVLTALDHACMGPTYRAGVLRQAALRRLEALEREHGVASVAFEMLGPPRLSKLLFEAELLRRVRGTVARILESSPAALAEDCAAEIERNQSLRTEILSVGIPILLPDGRRLLRGPRMVIPAAWDTAEPTPERRERWAEEGWVDLRERNFQAWQRRFRSIREEIEGIDREDTSSRHDRDLDYWNVAGEINIGKVLGWLFIAEERGLRMKA